MTDVSSWGHYPYFPQIAHPCYWRDDLPTTLAFLKKIFNETLPFGSGRSYGDSCLAIHDHVLHMRALNAFISANWETGLVVVEAGMTIEELLHVAIPKGWFIPVTPGTKFVTLGGALANDVHGKNHHQRGTFGQHVPRFSLVRSDHQSPLLCSMHENSTLYAATIGGLGLTGIVEWLELQLIPIQSSDIQTTQIPFHSLDEFFTLSTTLDAQHEYAVAWIDCLTRGQTTGRGIYFVGDHAVEGTLTLAKPAPINIPFTPPISAINAFTSRLFNTLYYRIHPQKHKKISYDPFFYPLDGILNWNRLYGARGFQQYQCVIPDACAKPALTELLKTITNDKHASCLTVLKRFGSMVSPGLLSFPQSGITLALDFPQQEHLNIDLFPRLDTIVREAGGRLYPAKDAHLSGADFRQFYPHWERVETLRDPALCSRFWRRVIT